MDPRGGNRRSRVLSHSTGFRSAPTGTKKHAGRPAGRSVSRTRKAENAQFWAGSRQGDGATHRRDRSRPQGAASNWLPSPTPRPTTGRFSKSSGPTNKRSTFFMPSQRGFRPSRATGTKNTAPRDDVGGKVGDPLSPRQGDDGTGGSQARTQVFPQAQTPHALREPQGQRLRAPASSANKVLVNQRMKRARWSMRSECPHHRWSDRPAWRLEPRTKRRTPLDGENPAVKTGSLAKIDPHPRALHLLGVGARNSADDGMDLLCVAAASGIRGKRRCPDGPVSAWPGVVPVGASCPAGSQRTFTNIPETSVFFGGASGSPGHLPVGAWPFCSNFLTALVCRACFRSSDGSASGSALRLSQIRRRFHPACKPPGRKSTFPNRSPNVHVIL